MRKITIELYANSEYALDDRLKAIRWAINGNLWPSSSFSEGSRKRLESGCIEEEKQYQLSDYEYDKEDPTWNSCSNDVTTGRWKMEVVPDQDYVDFQKTPEL